MDLRTLVATVINICLMPPTCFIVLALLGMLMRRRWPRTGRGVVVAAWTGLLVLSTSAGALLLAAPLEALTRPLASSEGAQAIVVLAAGNVHNPPEYGTDIPDDIALVRLRYAARLQHQTGLPLLVSGGNGSADGQFKPKAQGMASALREDFRTPVTWVEDRAENTAQNAVHSAAILKAAGVRRVLLVTHAMHMARAELAFKAAGLEVVAAPTMFVSHGRLSFNMFLPSATGLAHSYYAMHEWMGLLWYRLRPL